MGNLIFQVKNWFMWKKRFVYVLNYLKFFKAVQKNDPWMHSLQQQKKLCTPVRSQEQ